MSGYDSLYNRYMQEANAYASSYGVDPSTAHNGAGDAFRHAYASGAMAREYGETAAHVFGDLNEIRGGSTHSQLGQTNIIYYFIVALALFFSQNIYAIESINKPELEDNSAALHVSCPATNFSVFIRAFANNVNIQKEFIKYPLKNQFLDAHAEPKPKKITQDLARHHIQFPILPLHEERVKRSLDIHIDSATTNNARVTLIKPGTDDQVVYEFGIEEGACWQLLSVDDQSLTEKKANYINWIEGIFPSMANCTPISLYFDEKTKQSNDGFLEAKGYSAYKIDEYFATYKVKEKFFGFDATEIDIPAGTDSIYTVTVQASAKSLASVIKKKTGYRLRLYAKGLEPQLAVPYLVPQGKTKSLFICFTFEGGL